MPWRSGYLVAASTRRDAGDAPWRPVAGRAGLSDRLRVPGIIGGAGPGATARLYLDVLHRCSRLGLPNRPPVLIASLDIDLAVEERLLSEGEGVEGYLESLLRAARSLVAAGADFLAMPCNTLHVLMPQVRAAVPVPALSILDAVSREAHQVRCRTVGLLATTMTTRSGIYQESLAARGIDVVGIDDSLQEALQQQILAEVEQHGPVVDDLGGRIMNAFADRGVCAVVAGCTELNALMARWDTPLPVIDSLDALGSYVVAAMRSPEIT